MATYYTNELVFDLPDELKDKTHHIFSLVDEGPSEFNVVISRHPVGDTETLESYGCRLQTEMEKALPHFKLLGSHTIIVAGILGWGLEYRWMNQGQWLHQRQVSLLHQLTPGQRQVVQVTATATGEFTTAWKERFTSLLGSIRLRQADAIAR
jgi:hypothetical protein